MTTIETSGYLGALKDFFRRDMLKSNPTMKSARFKEDLEELQHQAEEWNDEDKDQ